VTEPGADIKIGIIGTGNISGTLARKLNEAGHEGKVANSRGVEAVRSFCTAQTPILTRKPS
jgi:predicted dinucleotide-binding enzyme